MSLHEFRVATRLVALDTPVSVLLMAVLLTAENSTERNCGTLSLLKFAFPSVWEEVQQRKKAVNNILEGEA